MKRKNGFTLIELLSTLIILGIVVTIAIQSYNVLIVKNDDSKYNYYWNFVEKASDLYFDARKISMVPGECLSVNYQALVDKNYLKEEGITCTGNIILRKESKKYVYDDTNIECKSNDKIVKEKGEVEAVCPVTQVFTFDDNYERTNDIATTMTASIDKWENVSTTHTVKKGYNLASAKRISFTECTGECGIYQNLTSRLIPDKAYNWSILLKANSGKTLKVGVGTNGIKTITTTGEWQKVSGEFIATSTDASKFNILSTNGWQASDDDLYINSVIIYEKSLSLKNKLAFEIDVPFGNNLPTPRRTGYDFVGWFAEKDGGVQITKDTIVPKIKNIIYYAHWIKSDVKVNYLPNGGVGTMTTDTVTYGNDYTIKNNTFTKTGYTFNYWKDNDNNKNFDIWQQTPITWNFDEDINLKATWKPNEYRVTLDANGGSVSPHSIPVIYDNEYGNLPRPTREGHTFNGWYTNPTTTGEKITVNTKIKIPSNHSIYAHWKAHTYVIRYDGNNSTGGSTPISTHTYDESKKLSTNGFRRNNYKFTGWNTRRDGSGITYADEAPVKNLTSIDNGEVVLYAQWRKNNFEVTLAKGEGISLVSGDGKYTPGTQVTINADLAPNSVWINWTGYETSKSKTYSFIMPEHDVKFTAIAHQHIGESGSKPDGCYTTKEAYGGSCPGHEHATSYACGWCGTVVKSSSKPSSCPNNVCGSKTAGQKWYVKSKKTTYHSSASKCSKWNYQYRYVLGCGYK